MGHIKEPKGIDFIISNDPLTDNARKEISEFIRNYKSESKNKKQKTETIKKNQKSFIRSINQQTSQFPSRREGEV